MRPGFERRSSLRDFLVETKQSSDLDGMIRSLTLEDIAVMIDDLKMELKSNGDGFTSDSIDSLLLAEPVAFLHAIHSSDCNLTFESTCRQLIDLFTSTSPQAYQEWLKKERSRKYPSMPVVEKIVSLENNSKQASKP